MVRRGWSTLGILGTSRMKKKEIIKNLEDHIGALNAMIDDEIAMSKHLEQALFSCENALLYKDELLEKAYRKIGELGVEGGL